MNRINIEVRMRMYEEQVRHARHHETLRTQSTNLIIVIPAEILAYLSSTLVLFSQGVVIGIFLILINLYGCIISLKHYDRSQMHLEVSRHFRDIHSSLSAAGGTVLNDVRKAGRDAYNSQPNPIRKLRVYILWSALHVIIALIGATLVTYEISFWASPLMLNTSPS